jgi:hypothetical protein
MIDLSLREPVLSRFADELEREAPLSLEGLAPDLSRARREDVDAAFVAWTARIVDEYRSVVVFSELFGLFAEIEMPYAALAAVSRLVDDELRHTRLCARVAEAFGDLGRLDIDLSDLGPPKTGGTSVGRAFELVVREIVVAETESVRVLAAYRDAASDPFSRIALSILLRDEVRHAAAGRKLEALMRARLPEARFGDALERVARARREDTAHIRRIYDESATGGPGRAFGAAIGPEDMAP